MHQKNIPRIHVISQPFTSGLQLQGHVVPFSYDFMHPMSLEDSGHSTIVATEDFLMFGGEKDKSGPR